MEKILINDKLFFTWLFAIALAGSIIRFININYASLWADELYSALLASPHNSWYEVLYIQRAYQPPLYAFMLWMWVKIFAYNEFYIRLLTVLGGIAAIIVSGYLGKKIRGYSTGLVMAAIVAFNPVQVWYSLEARFYVFVYVFAALSLLVYWHLITKKPKGIFIYLLKGIVDSTLCYFHHFGIIFIFSQFVYDLYLLRKEKDVPAFRKKILGYSFATLLYGPWVFWGLSQGLSVKQYWLKDIDVIRYVNFNMGYPVLINIIAFAFMIYFLFQCFKNKEAYWLLFPLICILVILVPVLYSYFKMPILVDRYAMVMAPVIYLMLAGGIVAFVHQSPVKFQPLFYTIIALLLIIPGINTAIFSRKDKLSKQPWREMASWLKAQKDLSVVNVYARGAQVKDAIDIDFYLEPEKKALQLANLKIGKDNKMYLVETNSVWKISDSVINKLNQGYRVQTIPFNGGLDEYGNIYVCTKK